MSSSRLKDSWFIRPHEECCNVTSAVNGSRAKDSGPAQRSVQELPWLHVWDDRARDTPYGHRTSLCTNSWDSWDRSSCRSLPKKSFASAGRFGRAFWSDEPPNEDARRTRTGSDSSGTVDRTWLVVRPTMELLHSMKALLIVALIRVSPSLCDDSDDLSTVS